MSLPLFSTADNYIATASGSYTTKYINVFEQHGTTCVLTRYFPGSGYSTALPSIALYPTSNVNSGIIAFVDLGSYGQSASQLIVSNALGQTHHERLGDDAEIGKIYIHPNYPYSSEYWKAVNIIGTNSWVTTETDIDTYIKDVILLTFNGSFWHLVNPRPKLINNQICYYESDLRCVTYASYDPFSRVFDQYGGLVLAKSYPDSVQDD
jgi:hypothetical protein